MQYQMKCRMFGWVLYNKNFLYYIINSLQLHDSRNGWRCDPKPKLESEWTHCCSVEFMIMLYQKQFARRSYSTLATLQWFAVCSVACNMVLRQLCLYQQVQIPAGCHLGGHWRGIFDLSSVNLLSLTQPREWDHPGSWDLIQQHMQDNLILLKF